MNILDTGLIHDFLELLGIQIITQTGAHIAFVVCGTLLAVCLSLVLSFLFKLIVYIRRG